MTSTIGIDIKLTPPKCHKGKIFVIKRKLSKKIANMGQAPKTLWIKPWICTYSRIKKVQALSSS